MEEESTDKWLLYFEDSARSIGMSLAFKSHKYSLQNHMRHIAKKAKTEANTAKSSSIVDSGPSVGRSGVGESVEGPSGSSVGGAGLLSGASVGSIDLHIGGNFFHPHTQAHSASQTASQEALSTMIVLDSALEVSRALIAKYEPLNW
eukprot:GHVP01009280.1.p1 GENE.GHVP01009280.1~~GHVP01009280.1.p1  ORF type:complete len:147 (+),score=22.85 GHVP01009280.1:48-488(+)